ncbi:MAG: hypothetical protein GC191_09150 [Azospirillum sp.]|nr:hypothetical protein [Azospirillum sp.]
MGRLANRRDAIKRRMAIKVTQGKCFVLKVIGGGMAVARDGSGPFRLKVIGADLAGFTILSREDAVSAANRWNQCLSADDECCAVEPQHINDAWEDAISTLDQMIAAGLDDL